MSEIPTEIPLKAENKFIIRHTTLQQQIKFYYYDPGLFYYTNTKLGLLNDVLVNIKNNMQVFIDEDKILINQKEVRLHITEIYLRYKKKKRFIHY
ncbi:MAG: hypothetical protein ACXAC7_00260 [Candidatus Hodarchaeales archaeon]